MIKDVDLSRRKFLLGSAGVLAGGVIAGGIGGSLIKPAKAYAALPGYLPVPTASLDVTLARKLGFHHYFASGGCMNAVASSLIECIKYALGANPNIYPPGPTNTDWDNIPTGSTSWYRYGSGGVLGWGTLCGTLNGAMAALNLMNKYSAYGTQIIYYYCQTELPLPGLHDLFLDPTYGWDTSFAPEPVPDDEMLAVTVADSPLCHVSVSKWGNAAGVNLHEPTAYGTAYKTDRCAKLSGDIAAFTATLINGATSNLVMPADTAACSACHNTSADSVVPGQQGMMDCGHCHTQQAVIIGKRHPGGGHGGMM
jgi:hypothetical protein